MYVGDLLDRFPIVAITGANYYPLAPGEPSANMPLQDHGGMFLETTLRGNSWPIRRSHGGLKERSGQQFALGSLVYAMFEGNDSPPYLDRKTWAKHLCYEKENSLSELTEMGVVTPMAWVMVDFDCPIGEGNLETILPVLQTTYPLGNWSVFDSGGSYYFLLEDMVGVKGVPWHYGKLVTKFACTALPGRRHIFEGIGRDLQKYWDDHRQLSRLSNDILDMICHYDVPPEGKKIPFIIDLRHMAHSLQEFLQYFQEKTGTFGYLRLSKKFPYDLPPVAVAKYSPKAGVKMLFDGTVFQSRQLQLPGIT